MGFFKTRAPLPKNLRICFVAESFPILGRTADRGFLWPIARGLAQLGHDVSVIAWKSAQAQNQISQDGVKAYFVGEDLKQSSLMFPFYAEKKFRELHAQSPIHIVHSLDTGGYNIGLNKKLYQTALVYDIEATQISQIFSILAMAQESLESILRTSFAVAYKFLTTYLKQDRKILKTADAVFVASLQQRLALERYYLYPEMKTHIVPYGIEIVDLSPREKSSELRAKFDIPSDAKVVVTVSDMTELQEVKSLLLAFASVAMKKPSARLVIIGNGPLKKEIEFEMLNLALGSRVIFTGALPASTLPDYISLSDIFVNLSSRTSGFEASLIEAMAQKKVIIGSEVSPMATIVESGTDGFLIRPADFEHLAFLLLAVCDGQVDSERVGENARAKVLNTFDIQKMIHLSLRAYQRALVDSGYFKQESARAHQGLASQT